MKFLMLVCREESIPFTTDDIGPEVEAWASEMEERGIRLQGAVFAPVNATATVSVRAGETHIDRGPRVEMAVPGSGFNLLHCADVDEAIEVSSKHPIARFGVIEPRPYAAGRTRLGRGHHVQQPESCCDRDGLLTCAGADWRIVAQAAASKPPLLSGPTPLVAEAANHVGCVLEAPRISWEQHSRSSAP